jgi:hypothetical protein
MRGKSSAALRGKVAEAEVRKILKAIESKNMTFTFNKNPDAHAAGGRAQPVAGDFQAFRSVSTTFNGTEGQCESRNFIIEVKEVKHAFRLPHGNYSEDKVSRVQKRVYAGTEAVVAVMHKDADDRPTGWRLVPQSVFTTRTGGSWDLSAHPLVDINRALRDFLGVA